MAETVVHHLEAVEIEEQHGHAVSALVWPDAGPSPADPRRGRGWGGGEGIVDGGMGQALAARAASVMSSTWPMR